jgi:hypothetical protein
MSTDASLDVEIHDPARDPEWGVPLGWPSAAAREAFDNDNGETCQGLTSVHECGSSRRVSVRVLA